jgi:Fur family transcriptional regulator, ferric uptake regulator
MSRAERTASWADRARQVLAESGHRTGQARDALVALLDAQTCARSVLEIEDSLRAGERPIARASIYRILDELERLHLVQKVQVGQDMARYEPVRSGEGHHHHLVCDNCGTVTPFTDEDLETAIRRVSRRLPMQVAEHEIVLHGSCADCTAG